MALHAELPRSPYQTLLPEQRWFPADESLRASSYEKLLPPLVAHIRREVQAWRDAGYAGASATSQALLRWWFEVDHQVEGADRTLASFRYYFAQREAVESVISSSSRSICSGFPRRARPSSTPTACACWPGPTACRRSTPGPS